MEKILTFSVVEDNYTSILGANACMELQLIKVMINKISENELTFENLKNNHKNVFCGLGELKQPYEMTMKPDVTPVVHPARRVPIRVKEKLK